MSRSVPRNCERNCDFIPRPVLRSVYIDSPNGVVVSGRASLDDLFLLTEVEALRKNAQNQKQNDS